MNNADASMGMRMMLVLLWMAGFVWMAPTISFERPKDIAQGQIQGVSSMDAGDIDRDGLTDVVVIEGGKHAGGRTAFFWFKAPENLQGTWRRYEINPDAPLRAFLGAARLADMDGDNNLDLVVSSDNHSGDSKQAEVLVFINPEPNVRATQRWSWHLVSDSTLSLHHINDMEIADMDADGKPDVVTRSLEPNQIQIFFQNNIASYTLKSIDTHIERSEGLAVGPINDDGLPDITYTGHWLQAPSDPRVQDYIRRSIDKTYQLINQNTKEAIGDIDGDGLPDVVIAPAEHYRDGKPHDLAWYRNPGSNFNGEWRKTVIRANVNDQHTTKLGDMDQDGDLDVVVGVPWGKQRVQIYRNEGTGLFGDPQTVHTGKGLYSGIVVDLDRDGDLDIVGQDTYADTSKSWVYESLLKD